MSLSADFAAVDDLIRAALNQRYVTPQTAKSVRSAMKRIRAAWELLARGPLTEDEAEAAYVAAKPAKISKKRLKEIVDYATSGVVKGRKPYRHCGTSSSMTPQEMEEDASPRFRDGGSVREWLDEIAAAVVAGYRTKRVPADVLDELLACKFVTVYGRGRNRKVQVTRKGRMWLR